MTRGTNTTTCMSPHAFWFPFVAAIVASSLSCTPSEVEMNDALSRKATPRLSSRLPLSASELPEPKVTLRNQGTVPARQIRIADGQKVYRIGSVTGQDILNDVLADVSASEEAIQAIYRYVSAAFSHKCSNGSFLDEEFKKEGILERLYSYSFGCCSDVNEPILSSLYQLAGFEGHSLRSPYHVAVEVCSAHSCFYSDADKNLLIPGSLADVRKKNASLATWFSDKVTFKSEQGALPHFRAQTVAPIRFLIYPGDEITFSMAPLAEALVYRPLPGDPPSIPSDMSSGFALIGLANYRTGTRGSCQNYKITFPYVMRLATIHGMSKSHHVEVQHGDQYIPMDGPHFELAAFEEGMMEATIAKRDVLDDWGGNSARSYLRRLENKIVTRSNMHMFSEGAFTFSLYEDGKELGAPHQRHKSIINDGGGRYDLYQKNHLIFSASDGSNPKTNRNIYRYKVAHYRALYSSKGRHTLAFRVCGSSPLSGLRLGINFQHNRNIFPTDITNLQITGVEDNADIAMHTSER